MKKKSVFWGIALILVAVYLIVSRLGLMPDVPFFTMLFTVIFAGLLIDGLVNRNIYEILLPAALLLCIYDEPLGITRITPWPILAAALLCSIGLNLIFKDFWRKRKNNAVYGNQYVNDRVDNSEDGAYVQVRNTFGGISKYVNTNYFSKAEISNTFGQCNVYFNNAVMANGSAEIHVSNSFGELNLFFPRTWRVDIKRSSAFGEVKERNTGNSDMDAPFVNLDAECNFGEINIYYE